MKTVKKYASILMILTLFVGFTSCEDDDTIFDHIVEGEPVESGITFKSNGFGQDEQWFYDWDQRAAILDVRWWIDHGDLYLDYGNRYPLLVLEAIYVDGRYLTGRLYSNNIDQGTVTLVMAD